MTLDTKRKKRKKIVVGVIASILVVLFAGNLFAANYLCNYAIGRSGDGGDRTVALEVQKPLEKLIEENKERQEQRNQKLLSEHPPEVVSITSNDSLLLKGFYFEEEKSHNWAITIHGYRADPSGSFRFAQRYVEEGYQVLAPALRCCGESEGEYVGMGWLDKEDILLWIDWILQRDQEARIVIHGVSMGGATTMMVAGEETPDQVVAFIEDCGYTSVWDIFSSELQLRFGLPQFPILYTASAPAKVKAGYSFQEASALEQVAKCKKPMLLIHGTEDDFVPYSMLQKLYDAKPGDNKQKLVAQGAGHGEAIYALGEEYWKNVFAFLEQY